MKEFDYKRAKACAPVCTRDGKPARIICWDWKDRDFHILALIEDKGKEEAIAYTDKGTEFDDCESPNDLFMADVTHGGWVLIDPEVKHCFPFVFDTQEEAEAKASTATIAHVVVAHIEWEE